MRDVPQLVRDETGYTVWDSALKRRVRLGRGLDQQEAYREYAEFLAWKAEYPRKPWVRQDGLLLSELFADYLKSPSRPADHLHEQARRAFILALNCLSPETKRPFLADSLTAPDIMRYQEWLAVQGYSYTYLKRNVGWLRRSYRWAYSRGLIQSEAYHGAVEAEWIQESACKPKLTRQPVPVADLEKVLPHLPTQIRAILQVMALTGMRPSEVCRMTPAAILQGGRHVLGGVSYDLGDEWLYCMEQHKTAGKLKRGRVVGLSAEARTILRPFMVRPADKPLFSPAERMTDMVGKRKVGMRIPGEAYSHKVVTRAIRAACLRAGVPVWTAYQLRYLGAAMLQRTIGPELTRDMLGHVSADMTAHYAGANVAGAILAAHLTSPPQ